MGVKWLILLVTWNRWVGKNPQLGCLRSQWVFNLRWCFNISRRGGNPSAWKSTFSLCGVSLCLKGSGQSPTAAKQTASIAAVNMWKSRRDAPHERVSNPCGGVFVSPSLAPITGYCSKSSLYILVSIPDKPTVILLFVRFCVLNGKEVGYFGEIIFVFTAERTLNAVFGNKVTFPL